MPRFTCMMKSPRYRVGCTGQRVYLYNDADEELASIRGLRYVYHAAISPDERYFAVRSVEGGLYLYDLPHARLLTRIRVAPASEGAQDGVFFFTSDSRFLLSVDHYGGIHARLSLYAVPGLTSVSELLGDSPTREALYCEPGDAPGAYFLMGYERNESMVAARYFVLPVRVGATLDIAGEEQTVTQGEYDLHAARLECLYGYGMPATWGASDTVLYGGFAFSVTDLEERRHSLGRLWRYYR